MRIPYSTEQGIILTKQGILAREQGILSAGIELIAGMRFSAQRTSVMSAGTPKADINPSHCHVRFVPLAVVSHFEVVSG